MEDILVVNNLSKSYGNFDAVKNLSFVVPKGKVIGFLGPNGAGKTTSIQMLLGITTQTSGTIKYFGKDLNSHKAEILHRINFTSSFNTLLGRITAFENLMVFSSLYSVKNPKEKIRQLATYFQIEGFLNKRYLDLSAGQKTRVNLVKSLLNDPELILMDEPTASLDPDIADKTLSLIEDMRETRNLSLLFTSHDMDEVTRICDEVIFLDRGEIIAQDTPLNLTKRIASSVLQITFKGQRQNLKNYLKEKGLTFDSLNEFLININISEDRIPQTIMDLGKIVEIIDIEIRKPTLDDFFLSIARKESHESI